jgi:oligopeptide transport system substrate-binding protein
MNTNKTVTRRAFLKIAGITAGAATLAACTPQVVTQIVEQTSIVKQTVQVNQTSVVQVTPTNPPLIVTPQGRTLPADAAPLDKQVTQGSGSEPKFFDGIRDIYNTGGLQMLNSTLIHNDENYNLVPNLAESWKPGPENRYWEFVVQKDAVWSDGSPVTADDIVFTFVHLAAPETENPWMWFFNPVKGLQEFQSGKFPQSVVDDPKTGGVRKVDDKTVQIYGDGPDANGDPVPYLPALLAYQASVFIPKAQASKDPLHWADKGVDVISGGPWLLTAWNHNASLVYDINPKYNLPFKAGIQHETILIGIANQITSFLNFELDVLTGLGASDVAMIRADPKLNPLMHFFSWFQTTYLELHHFMSPTDNLKFDMALAKSLDRDSLNTSINGGLSTSAYSMLPPGFPGHNPDLDTIQAFDVAAAQQLLSDAGYPKGVDPKTGKPVSVELWDSGQSPYLGAVKQMWEANLGITVNYKVNESGAWGTNRAQHKMQIAYWGYEYDYVDPYDLITMLFHSSQNSADANKTPLEKWGANYFPWYNKDADAAMDAAGLETDVTKRIADFQTAEKIMCSDPAVIFMTHQVKFQIWWPYILGLKPDASGNVYYRFLDASAMQVYISKDVDAIKAQYKSA